MYHLFNVVTAQEGVGEAVLIRALEPLEGIELMRKKRKRQGLKELCSGPAKLVNALGIHPKQNGLFLGEGALILKSPTPGNKAPNIQASSRIGISKGAQLPYRFCESDSPYLSRFK